MNIRDKIKEIKSSRTSLIEKIIYPIYDKIELWVCKDGNLLYTYDYDVLFKITKSEHLFINYEKIYRKFFVDGSVSFERNQQIKKCMIKLFGINFLTAGTHDGEFISRGWKSAKFIGKIKDHYGYTG